MGYDGGAVLYCNYNVSQTDLNSVCVYVIISIRSVVPQGTVVELLVVICCLVIYWNMNYYSILLISYRMYCDHNPIQLLMNYNDNPVHVHNHIPLCDYYTNLHSTGTSIITDSLQIFLVT